LNPILSQINPIYILPPHSFKIYFNIILHLCLSLIRDLVLSGFPVKILCSFVILPMPCASHPFLIYHSNNIMGKSTNYEARHYVIFSILLLRTYSYVNSLFLDTLNLCSSCESRTNEWNMQQPGPKERT
jgi:hypothetical protein